MFRLDSFQYAQPRLEHKYRAPTSTPYPLHLEPDLPGSGSRIRDFARAIGSAEPHVQ
jgi:hypothetical protein